MREIGAADGAIWRRLLFLIVPVAVAFAVYANTLDAEFVYDDSAQIVHNPWVRELRHFPKAVTRPVWAFQTTISTNYLRPLQMGAYNLLWNASGGNPFPFHLVNVLLHGASTAALAWLVLALSRRREVAFGAALLFAVHPLNSETIAWIACLPELGYTTFGLLALILHVEGWSATPGRRRRFAVAEVVAFALALLSKETAVTLVPLVVLLEFWVRPDSGGTAARLSRSVVSAVPYAVAIAIYAVLRFVALGGIAPLSRPDLTAWDAVLNAPWLLLAYLGKMVWPASLVAYHVFDPVRSMSSPAFFLSVPVIAALLIGVLRLSRQRPDLAFAAALILAPLVPVLYVPAVGLNAFAERYAYLPTAGFCWLLAAAIRAAVGTRGGQRSGAIAVALCVALSLPASARTIARNRVWHDDERLASTTVRQSPGSRVMWGLLGGAYRTTNRPGEALRTYEQALTHFPNDPLIRTDVVGIQLTLGAISPEEAARRLLQILDEGTVVYEMYVYLGRAYGLAGKPAESERAYRRAIELNPSSKPAQNGLALALIGQGKREVDTVGLLGDAGFAIGGELDRLIEGAAELNADRIDAAERIFREVLATHPESAGALLYLGLASAQRGNHADTVDFCRRAIALRPDLVDAHQQLGVSALALGRLDDAVAALETAAKLSPRRKEVYNRLGVAYVRSGRPEEARRAWLTALEIDPAFERARFNLERLESRP